MVESFEHDMVGGRHAVRTERRIGVISPSRLTRNVINSPSPYAGAFSSPAKVA